MKTSAAIAGLLVLGAAPLAAQQPINERISTRPTGLVEVSNVAGSVQVVGWDRAEVQVTGTLGRGAERVEVSSEGDRVRIRVILPQNARNIEGTDLQIRMPARKDVQVRTVSAGITAGELTGRVEAQSVSGAVRISGAPSEAVGRSTSGSVEIGAANATRIEAASVSGSVRLTGSARQSVDAETVSGSLSVQVTTPQVRAKSVSGGVEVQGVGERVSVNSVSGRVRVAGGQLRNAEIETVSGSITLEGVPPRGGTVNVTSHSGSVDLRFPANVAADFTVRTFSGSIRNAFGPAAERTGRYTPESELRFATAQGGARVSVRTFSGSVNLVRQ